MRYARGGLLLLTVLAVGCARSDPDIPRQDGDTLRREADTSRQDLDTGEERVQVPVAAKPRGLSAIPLEDTLAIRLSWRPVETARFYEIWRADRAGPVFTWLARTDDTAFVDRAVFPRTDYGYRIRGGNGAGSGPFSDTVYVTAGSPDS